MARGKARPTKPPRGIAGATAKEVKELLAFLPLLRSGALASLLGSQQDLQPPPVQPPTAQPPAVQPQTQQPQKQQQRLKKEQPQHMKNNALELLRRAIPTTAPIFNMNALLKR